MLSDIDSNNNETVQSSSEIKFLLKRSGAHNIIFHVVVQHCVSIYSSGCASLKPEPCLDSGLLEKVHEPEQSFKFPTNL